MIVLEDAFFSALAAMGFAMLFNVPRRTLWGCILCGAIGHACRTLLIEYTTANIVSATLGGSIIVGFLGGWLAERHKAPAPIFTVAGVIPMVPGVFAYNTMLGLIDLVSATPLNGNAILAETSINAVKTALILAALGAGIITPQLLFKRTKPVV